MPDIPEKINLSDVNSRQVDPELLNELRDLFVKAEEQKERYDFTWNGKAKAYFEAAAPTTKTLRAQPEESLNFEKSENLFITGDNLEALKLLQESYLGKIDMIYIDPPYNTGKDFVYQDNFKKTQKENDVSEGIIDEDGNRLVKNEKSNGRYHSDWLTMMYPRLKLARNLLSDTGAIFVSIDDNEQSNLKLLMDEIFGEKNFLNTLTRITKKSSNNGTQFSPTTDYILAFSKDIEHTPMFSVPLTEEQVKSFNKIDEVGNFKEIGLFQSALKHGGSRYPIETPDGTMVNTPNNQPWRWNESTFIEGKNNKLIVFKQTNNSPLIDEESGEKSKWNIYTKLYLRDRQEAGLHPKTFIDNYQNNIASRELKSLGIPFDFAKPSGLVKYLMNLSHNKNLLVLDFFAGSATTADAVMQLNAEDGGNRKWILNTLDEKTPENSEARKAGYTTIDQISRERIRRAAEKIGDTSGFRALKVDATGLKEDVFKTAGELDQADLLEDIDNHSDNRSDYDLLYDVLVDGALEYNRPITIDTMNDEQIIKYDYLGELSGVVCYFGENLTDELTRQIATLKPLIAVFKESTFDKSAQKVNVMEQFRIISPDTKVKVI